MVCGRGGYRAAWMYVLYSLPMENAFFFFYLHLFNFSWKYFSCMCWFSLGITLSAFSILAATLRSISAGWKLQHYKDALVRCLVHAICLRIVSYTDTYAEWPFYLIFGFWFFHSLSKIWAMILKLLFLFYFFSTHCLLQ